MKKIILIISLLVAGSTISFAQCDKNLVFTSSKTEHLDAKGGVTKTDDETALVELTKTTIDITVNGEHKMTGTIKSGTCNWKTPFKDGLTSMKIELSDDHGDGKNVTITIEGKDGKVTLLFEMEGMPDDRIKVTADKFGEKS